MKKNIFYSISFFFIVSFNIKLLAQYCTNDNRFTDVEIFATNQIQSDLDVTYGNANTYLGANQVLKFNIHYPKLTSDPLSKKPLIILIHGGAFTTGNKNGLNNMCKYFAKRGYVAATVEYRLGWNCQPDPLSYYKAVYRAEQDVHAATRYLVANATNYGIDTSWIFVGGESAGAVTSLFLAYASQSDLNTDFPTYEGLLGSIHNSGNTLTNKFTIKGIFNNWGMVGKEYVKNDIMLPMISFHGDNDVTVAIDSVFDGGCYNNVSNAIKLYGSRSLHSLSLSKGVCSGLTVKLGGDHGIYNETSDGDIFRVSRAACFFKSVFCNTCSNYYSTDSILAGCSTITGVNTSAISKNNIFISPNPTQSTFTILGLENIKNFEVDINDMYGKQILNLKETSIIDLSSYNSGIYFISVKTDEKKITYKVLKN